MVFAMVNLLSGIRIVGRKNLERTAEVIKFIIITVEVEKVRPEGLTLL